MRPTVPDQLDLLLAYGEHAPAVAAMIKADKDRWASIGGVNSVMRGESFLGSSYRAPEDGARLTSQLRAVEACLRSGRRWRLHELTAEVSRILGRTCSESSISAKVRVLRQPPHGLDVRSERVSQGAFRYYLNPEPARVDADERDHTLDAITDGTPNKQAQK